MLVDPNDEIPVASILPFCSRALHLVPAHTNLEKIMSQMQSSRSHLFFVSDERQARRNAGQVAACVGSKPNFTHRTPASRSHIFKPWQTEPARCDPAGELSEVRLGQPSTSNSLTATLPPFVGLKHFRRHGQLGRTLADPGLH